MKIFLLGGVFILTLTIICNAESLKDKNFGNVIVKEISSIYDADTFRANIQGWPEYHRVSNVN
jgi:hypothetical protein